MVTIANGMVHPMGVIPYQMATFATTKKGPLDGKQKGDEKVYFDKQDQQTLQKLLKKLQDQEKQQKAEENSADKQADALKKLLKDHKIAENQEFINDLLEWRKKL